jgi:hypothetical protein
MNVAVAWGDRWYDPVVGLLWNPAGSFAPAVRDGTVHLLPQSAWYAFGLLERGRPGDLDRATRVLDAVLNHQYDLPGTPWNGTFARVAEAPEPTDGAREWVDYDPNWRQFIASTFLMILRHHADRIDSVLISRLDRSIDLAVRGEPEGRIEPGYSNIALMHAFVAVEFGSRSGDSGLIGEGERLAAAVVEAFDRCGALDEYNSPTYYGMDLLALAMWRTCAASEMLQRDGLRLEAQLWMDLAMFFHAGMRNVIGPFDRTYGMDMTRYLAMVGLWWIPGFGVGEAPVPDLATDAIVHGHDLLVGPLIARLAGPVPRDAVEFLRRFEGVRALDRPIGVEPSRSASAWLEPDLAFGGQEGEPGRPAAGQFAPATVHWLLPVDTAESFCGVGSVRFFCDDPTSARAGDAMLRIGTTPDGEGPADAWFLVSTGGAVPLSPAMVGPGRWDLPGLTLRVQANGALVAVEPFGDDLLVGFRAGPGGHRFTLRRVGDA